MSRYRSQELLPEHDISAFACGNLVLDDWLRRLAGRAQTQGTARTVVWLDGTRVVGYFSVAPTLIAAAGMSRRLGGGVTMIPGFLLGRLALDASIQGQGLGTDLLFDALATICRAATISSGRLIIVDPINAAATTFYAHHGFESIKSSPRMVMLTSRAQETLRILGH
jgi:GNAT superfamily N-acetyltransferase